MSQSNNLTDVVSSENDPGFVVVRSPQAVMDVVDIMDGVLKEEELAATEKENEDLASVLSQLEGPSCKTPGNSKSETDSDADTVVLMMADPAREINLLKSIKATVTRMPPLSSAKQLITESIAVETKEDMRRYILLLCSRLGCEARERYDFQKTTSYALRIRWKALKNLRAERKRYRQLSFHARRVLSSVAKRSRFRLTDAEKEDLKKVKELVCPKENEDMDTNE